MYRQVKSKHKPSHQCEIIKGSDSCLPKLPPQAGKVRRFLRNCRKLLGVTETLPECREVLRSRAALKNERIRAHRLSKWYIIHPFSELNMWREKITLIAWFFVFYKDPFALAFLPVHHRVDSSTYYIFAYLSEVILATYYISCFITGET